METQIIILNGPSGSGKSTLARLLQDLILRKCGDLYEIVSIDDFLKMSAHEAIYEDDVFAVSPALAEASSHAAQTGGVIIDHVITSKRILDKLTEAFHGRSIKLIRVTCPTEVLRAREAARGNRCPGSAEASELYLYPKEGYDLTVDTHDISAEECAKRIYQCVFPTGDGVPIHFMGLHPAPFDLIREGKKTIELRLYDEKRKRIQIGDRILFENTEAPELLLTQVTGLAFFDSFDELYKALPLMDCGYTEDDIESASPADMEAYYSKEEQARFGVVGIKLAPEHYVIEQARGQDLSAAAALASKLWEHPAEELAAEFSALTEGGNGALFLAKQKEADAGFAQCQLRHDYVEGTASSPVGYLEGIYVEEPHRRRGAAAALLYACQEWAKKQGCAEFASDCEQENADSLRFHQSTGFREANRIVCFTKKL